MKIYTAYTKKGTVLILAFIGVIVPIFLWKTLYSRDAIDCSTQKSRHFRGNNSEKAMYNSKFEVPNIVHFIWWTDKPKPFLFHQMLSVLSAHKNIKPDEIHFHTNLEPIGKYWDVVKQATDIRIIYEEYTVCLFGEPVKKPHYDTSASDVDRLRILAETGGIYMDLDAIAVQSFDDLRRYPCTLGVEKENPVKLCGGITVCSKNSVFLTLWLNAFLDDYRVGDWAYNSGTVPTKLWKRYPHLLHVEHTKLDHPNFYEVDRIWGSNQYNWKRNYAIHLWYRKWKTTLGFFENWWRGRVILAEWWGWGVEPDIDNIQTWKGTFGEMARDIIGPYGNVIR